MADNEEEGTALPSPQLEDDFQFGNLRDMYQKGGGRLNLSLVACTFLKNACGMN